MPTLQIDGNDYPVYADVDFIDQYLAGDMLRAEGWAAVDPTDKLRAAVSATRLLQRLGWKDGVPSTEDPPLLVQQATALLAADIAGRPALGDSGSTASNVKAVGAGPARVEFFRPTEGHPLPSAAWDLLRGLLGPAPGSGLDDPALNNTAYGSSGWQRSRFGEPCDGPLSPWAEARDWAW